MCSKPAWTTTFFLDSLEPYVYTYVGYFSICMETRMTFDERSEAEAKPTFDETVNGYMEQRDKFIGEHSKVFNTLYQLNLDVLGLIPDDERKDLLEGIKDYTYLTMCDGMDLFADMLLGMICDKYPVIGLKIKKNKEKYVTAPTSSDAGQELRSNPDVDKKYVGDLIGSDVSDNSGAKKVKRRSRRPKQESTGEPKRD